MWLQKIKIVVVSILIFFITACGSRALQNGKEFNMQELNRLYSQNRVISASAPSKLNPPFIGYYRFDEDFLDFSRTIPNMMSENIRLTIYKEDEIDKLSIPLDLKEYNNFDKNYINSPIDKKKIYNYQMKETKYIKKFISYIDGLKCETYAESNSISDGIGNKWYGFGCSYYSTNGSKKELQIWTYFTITYNGIKFEDSKYSSLDKYKLKDIELQYKKDMNNIFNSIKIHDIDIKKMKDLGMYHPHKKFNFSNENRAKNLVTW